ncbi:TPA: hypothetical protein ACOD9X_004541 [Stenotrophomonas maltophilia]|uniref:hypothetical protein n=1 Tax=Stenotrophomonas maltophilia TaxID=40324 RepID=UPI000A6EE5BD|nr:hypothetical protein [Stenotrophomonas maltophilia]MBN4952789.1 hypothetical protein [Stenotrophomonas maltophilia]
MNWDEDISCLGISDYEKNGLQVYRNYTLAFERERLKRFVGHVDRAATDTAGLEKVLDHLLSIEVRTAPVVVCAYVDDELARMFRREIPADVPGGRSDLLTGYGSLSRLSQRIQISHAFNWLSADLATELNVLRKLRNEISHSWNLDDLEAKIDRVVKHGQKRIETVLLPPDDLLIERMESLPLGQIFRVRLIWILARAFYECELWAKAVKARLDPFDAIYGEPRTNLLSAVSKIATNATIQILRV